MTVQMRAQMRTQVQEPVRESVQTAGVAQGFSHRDSGPELEQRLQPLLAGARARGMVEAFELAGLGVVLLDVKASVLFASTRARGLMEATIQIADGHLIGSTPATNALVQRCIEQALGVGEGAAETVLADGKGDHKYLKIRSFPVPGAACDPGQLAKAVLLFEDC